MLFVLIEGAQPKVGVKCVDESCGAPCLRCVVGMQGCGRSVPVGLLREPICQVTAADATVAV